MSWRLRIRQAIKKDHSCSKPGGITSDGQPNSPTPVPHNPNVTPDIGHINDDIIIDGDVSSEPDSTCSTGRQIEKLLVVAETLKSCDKCMWRPFYLHHTVGINTYGLAAFLKVILQFVLTYQLYFPNIYTGLKKNTLQIVCIQQYKGFIMHCKLFL